MTGRFTFTVREGSKIVAQGEGDNLMCSAGYNVLAQALLFSAASDQNANLGFVIPPAYLFPVYGAIGTGATAPASTDLQLTTEVARATVYTGSASASTWTLNFFFGTSSSYTIQEAGVFVQASATANSGQLLDHALISPSVTKNVGQTATLSITFSMS